MKKMWLISFLFLTGMSSAFAGNIAATYEISYKKGFFGTQSFTVTYAELESGQKYGDVEVEFQDGLGICTNVSNLGGSAEYGYRSATLNNPLTRLSRQTVTHIFSTIFCDSGWYNLVVEFPVGAFKTSSSVSGAFYLQDSRNKVVLDRAAVIKKVSPSF